MTTYECEFAIRDRVHINGCESIVALVTEVTFRGHHCFNVLVKTSWFHEGVHREEWFYEWQLTKVG